MSESLYKDIPILANESTRSVQEAIAQGYDFHIGEILSKAESLIKGLKLPMFQTIIASIVFTLVIQMILAIFPPLIAGSMYFLFNPIITGIVAGGTIAITQRHLRGEKVVFINDFLCIIPIAKTLILANLLAGIFVLIAFAISGSLIFLIVSSLSEYPFSIISIAFIILPIYLGVSYCLINCVIVNNPGIGIWEALETSRKLVSKHWFKVFGLLIILGLITFISAIPLGIGLLWTIPLYYLCISILYQTIIKQ